MKIIIYIPYKHFTTIDDINKKCDMYQITLDIGKTKIFTNDYFKKNSINYFYLAINNKIVKISKNKTISTNYIDEFIINTMKSFNLFSSFGYSEYNCDLEFNYFIKKITIHPSKKGI